MKKAISNENEKELYIPNFIKEIEANQKMQLEKLQISNQAYIEGCYKGWLESIGEAKGNWTISPDGQKLIQKAEQ